MTTKKSAPANQAKYDDEVIEDFDEAAELISVTYTITSYGADYPVDSLVKRIDQKDIIVPTFDWDEDGSEIAGFQRDYVWPRPKADRFIESLLLGLPVPGIFLVKESTGRLLVLDGHQRLHTLHAFCKNRLNEEEYRLSNVQDRFVDKRYKDLDVEDRRRLDDSIIHATIVRQDEPSDDQSSIYVIFERLNTGGVNLQPQEIRVALYHGEFVRLLRDLNAASEWRKLFGKRAKRLKDMELILRFLAFLFNGKRYQSPMKLFLNGYMGENRSLAKQSEKLIRDIFMKTTAAILTGIGPTAFRPKRGVNAAAVDSIMTGVATRIQKKGPIARPQRMRAAFDTLMKDPDYREAIETGTSQEANVETRISKAIAAFAQIP